MALRLCVIVHRPSSLRMRLICSGAWPLRASSLSWTVGACSSLLTMAAVAASRACSCSGVSGPRRAPRLRRSPAGGSRRRAGAAPPAAAPRRATSASPGTRATSRSTSASAAAASLRRSRRLASATDVQVVEVVEEDAVELAHRGLDVARHRDVDEEQRPLPPAALPRAASTSSLLDDGARRAGAADHDVGHRQLLAQRVEAAPRARPARPPAPRRARGCARPAPWPARRRAPGGARPARSSCPRPPAARSCPSARRRSCGPAPRPRRRRRRRSGRCPSRCAPAWPRPASGCAARSAPSPACPPPPRPGRPPSPGPGSAARRSPSSPGWRPRGRRGARPPRPPGGTTKRARAPPRAAVEGAQERGQRASGAASSRRGRRSPRGCRSRGSWPPPGRPRRAAARSASGRRVAREGQAPRAAGKGRGRWLTPTTNDHGRSSAPPRPAAREHASSRRR